MCLKFQIGNFIKLIYLLFEFPRTGGINPNFAQELHRMYIESVVDDALNEANLSVDNLDAIAVTSRPGMIYECNAQTCEYKLIVSCFFCRN